MPVTHLGPRYTQRERLTYEFLIHEETEEKFNAQMDIFNLMVEEIGTVIEKYTEPILR